MRRMLDNNINPEIPTDPSGNMVNLFIESGMVAQTGWGLAPLGWADIAAFLRISRQPAYKGILLHQMSVSYASARNSGDKSDAPCPIPNHAPAVRYYGLCITDIFSGVFK
jgi:hypothetical protein